MSYFNVINILSLLPHFSPAVPTDFSVYRIRTRAVEGVFITGHFYVWIGDLGIVPVDVNGKVNDATTQVRHDSSAASLQTLLSQAMAVANVPVTSVAVTRSQGHVMYGMNAQEWRITFSTEWKTRLTSTASNTLPIVNYNCGSTCELRVEYRRPLVWPRQEWIFNTFHSGGDGYEPTLLGISEPLRGLPPTKNVFYTDGEIFYKHNNWNLTSFVAQVRFKNRKK